mgnify:FL=1
MTRELLQQALDALEPAQVAKLSDGTYLDKDCKITMAIAALRAALADPQGWRPIETAPKDGYFLVHEDGAIRVKLRHKGVFGEITYPTLIANNGWKEVLVGNDAKRVLEPMGYTLGLGDGCCTEPTHWMPLPPAPEEQKT